MAQRSVEILLPLSCADRAREVLGHHEHTELLFQPLEQDVRIELLLPTQGVEPLLDELRDQFPGKGDLRAVVHRIEVGIPERDEPPKPGGPDEPPPRLERSPRISREELKSVLQKSSRITDTFLLLVVLSTIVAVIGLYRSNPAIIIGAMVIAPLLGPNMGLALSLTLGDGGMFARAIRANLAGIALALGLSLAIAPFLDLLPLNAELLARTAIGPGDIGLALASGVAGAVVLTVGEGMSLVGVMVAVALLPPLVTFGLCLGQGAFNQALGALMLLITNVICIELASVATFLIRGYRPRAWWAAHKSVRRSRQALTVYIVVLLFVGAYILAVELGFLSAPAAG
jgi:uncharacterized hydrophobic protein (TIGR00341 family)